MKPADRRWNAMSEDKRRLPTAANPGEVSAEVDAFLRDLQRAAGRARRAAAAG